MSLVPASVQPYRPDQTFLPAALEILETPASPVRMTLLLLICGFVAVALLWASVGRLDVVATAQGKIIPVGKVKVVQPLQTGKIATIVATNGDHVVAGQILATLDDRDAQAQLVDHQQALASLRAEIARREVAIAAAAALGQGRPQAQMPAPVWSSDIPPDIRLRESRVLTGDLDQLFGNLASLDAQLVQREAEQTGLRATIARQGEYVGTLQDRVAMREALVDKEAGSKADWLGAVGNLKEQQVALAQDQGQLATSIAQSDVLSREWTKAKQAFIDDNLQKLADAAKQADAIAQRLRQAQLAVEQLTLRSPIDGVVQATALTSIGQVVTTGEEVMRVVPVDAPIEVEAYLPSADAGFVHVGQKVVVKVDAFPFTRYGTIEGKVESIGRDAISSSDAQRVEADAARALETDRPGTAPGGALVFPVVVRLMQASVDADGNRVPLTPGMGIVAEVDTGSRTILEYIFSPLVQASSTAMHER